ncbi:hypothetical protein RCH17_001437 [Arthrobacter sp. MP_M7]|nr:hypothetical protein [Arthrobacter sp. MP_M4]MEC5202633.1 hypothetical protein [Arthrobacter sp. MP_M7]
MDATVRCRYSGTPFSPVADAAWVSVPVVPTAQCPAPDRPAGQPVCRKPRLRPSARPP